MLRGQALTSSNTTLRQPTGSDQAGAAIDPRQTHRERFVGHRQ